MMTEQDLDAIEERCERATAGPWYWRAGKHTESAKTSDAGGLHTRTPFTQFKPDGTPYKQDAVIFPFAAVSGDPYWVERLKKHQASGRPTLALALECFGREEDKEFIACARDDVADLVAEVRRLRALLPENPPSK